MRYHHRECGVGGGVCLDVVGRGVVAGDVAVAVVVVVAGVGVAVAVVVVAADVVGIVITVRIMIIIIPTVRSEEV